MVKKVVAAVRSLSLHVNFCSLASGQTPNIPFFILDFVGSFASRQKNSKEKLNGLTK
jgi:hypothetical protein